MEVINCHFLSVEVRTLKVAFTKSKMKSVQSTLQLVAFSTPKRKGPTNRVLITMKKAISEIRKIQADLAQFPPNSTANSCRTLVNLSPCAYTRQPTDSRKATRITSTRAPARMY